MSDGKVITVMNMKGGVGKTTVCTHLAGALARYGLNRDQPRKILAIDYDPQFNMSQAFMTPKTYFSLEKQGKTTISILLDDFLELDPYVLQVPGNLSPPAVVDLAHRLYSGRISHGQLDIIPSTLDLMYVALGRADANVKPIQERFAKFIFDARKIYELVLIDCHPAGSIFTQTSLSNSDHVLIPVMPQRYAVRGVGLMFDFLKAKEVSGRSVIPHILFNGVARRGIDKVETDIRNQKQFTPHCMLHTLKKYKAFSEPEGGVGFVWASRKPYSTEAFSNLCYVAQELVNRIGA